MYTGRLCGGNHGRWIRVWLETSDILRDGTDQELNILRQVAYMTAECIEVPLIQSCAIDAYLTAHRCPHADQRARKT